MAKVAIDHKHLEDIAYANFVAYASLIGTGRQKQRNQRIFDLLISYASKYYDTHYKFKDEGLVEMFVQHYANNRQFETEYLKVNNKYVKYSGKNKENLYRNLLQEAADEAGKNNKQGFLQNLTRKFSQMESDSSNKNYNKKMRRDVLNKTFGGLIGAIVGALVVTALTIFLAPPGFPVVLTAMLYVMAVGFLGVTGFAIGADIPDDDPGFNDNALFANPSINKSELEANVEAGTQVDAEIKDDPATQVDVKIKEDATRPRAKSASPRVSSSWGTHFNPAKDNSAASSSGEHTPQFRG